MEYVKLDREKLKVIEVLYMKMHNLNMNSSHIDMMTVSIVENTLDDCDILYLIEMFNGEVYVEKSEYEDRLAKKCWWDFWSVYIKPESMVKTKHKLKNINCSFLENGYIEISKKLDLSH